MAEIRVVELAKSLGVPAGQLLEELRMLGCEVKSNFSILSEEDLLKLSGGSREQEEELVEEETQEAVEEQESAEVVVAEEEAGAEEPEGETEEAAEESAEPVAEPLEEEIEAEESMETETEIAAEETEDVAEQPIEAEEAAEESPQPVKEAKRIESDEEEEAPAAAVVEKSPVTPAQPSGAPPAAPGVSAPKKVRTPARAKGRQAPKSDARRKTKRERRMEKRKSKADRQKRLRQELDEARSKAQNGEAIFIREGITVKELAEKLDVKVKDIISKLIMRGVLVTINQPLDGQVAVEVSSMFGFQAEIISYEDELVLMQEKVPDAQMAPRAPVVTVMGHVDHGKSTLLEAIHNVNITSRESGGITQHIGAYKVKSGEREFVFLDTPGHEAFTLMRARGAQVTDIVILVVAADDGVMPQTIEAINHCKAGDVPIVVAINKMDKPGANPQKVKEELSRHGVLVEDLGGDVVSVPISAKTGKGVDELLDMVAIVAEMLKLEAAPHQPCSGTVLESKLDKAKGPVATVLIHDGTLKTGDLFLCGLTYGHVRSLLDDTGTRVDEAGPSSPVEVLGFPEVPEVGALFQGMTDEAKARQVASFRKEQERSRTLRGSGVRLDSLLGAIEEGKVGKLMVVLKADVQGSLEAIAEQLNNLATEEVEIEIVHSGVGAVSESDILLASASKAVVIGFGVRPEKKAIELAKAEGVDMHFFTVIYDLVDRMKQALSGILKPLEEEIVLGRAEVKEIFRVSKVGTIAGCIVTEGLIKRSGKVRVLRDNVIVHTGNIGSLKHFKDDASEIKQGTECGIGIERFNDVKPGDVLESFEIKFTERTLD